MKEYRILTGTDATNEEKINELARQGFVISPLSPPPYSYQPYVGDSYVVLVQKLYMERDIPDENGNNAR